MCLRCDTETRQELVRFVQSSGAEHIGCWCLSCDNLATRDGRTWVSAESVRKHFGVDDLGFLRVARDLRLDAPRCGRCGDRGAERHHWAPTAIFGEQEANLWPTDFLCRSCHRIWHVAVTPQLVNGGVA